MIQFGRLFMKLIDILQSDSSPFAIYGAQVVAYGAYKAIWNLCRRIPECFIVSNLNNNPQKIDNISIRTLDAVSQNTLIVVGVTELLQGEILSELRARNYCKIFILTHHEEHLLMSEYFGSIGMFPVVCGMNGQAPSSVDLALYEICNHNDKPLCNPPKHYPFEITLQAGASLTPKRIAVLSDNAGENISQKNKQYCEMTGVYWIWKNECHEWIGIEHYRRHLFVKPEMLTDKVDAVLPLPYMCYPNMSAQFRRFVSGNVLQALHHALKFLYPEEYDRYQTILSGPYQYTYNLLCVRQNVFNDYCQWFFSITEYMETMTEQIPEIKNTRALSYVAEVLTNLYFMDNKNKWKIRHTEKGIYV